jgi:hypothetical protein
MCIERYTVARSVNIFCHENATTRFLFIVGVNVAVNSIKVFSVTMKI